MVSTEAAKVARRTGAPATVSLPQSFAWALSILLVMYGLLPLLDLAADGKVADHLEVEPTFLALRDEAQGGAYFTENRIHKHYVHYLVLHTVPGILWCCLIPIQNSDYIRLSRPALHRASGYVVASISFLLTISGIAFPIRKHLFNTNISYSHDNIFHLHKLAVGGRTVLLWPSFDAALVGLFPIQLYTLVRAVRAARLKKYAEHRTWAIFYSISGYLISLQRLGVTFLLAAGALLATAVSDERKRGWRIPAEGPEQWRAEMAGFAGVTWLFGAGGMILWMSWTERMGKAVWSETRRPAIKTSNGHANGQANGRANGRVDGHAKAE